MATTDLTTSIERTASGVTVSARGELDLASSRRLTDALAAAFELADECVLDLRPLTFIDSTGLRTLLSERGAASARGLRLRVELASDGPVHDIVVATGLTDALLGRGR